MEIEFGNIEPLEIETGIASVYPQLENLNITPTTEQQVFNHQNSYGYDTVTVEAINISLQEKEVTPTKQVQEIIPDSDYDGLSKVTLNEIPNEYIIPNGQLNISENGIHDVTDKASVNVDVPMPTLGTKTITQNGTYLASDDNLDGYSEVEVATSGVDIYDYFKSEAPTGTSGNDQLARMIVKIPEIDTSKRNSMNSFFSNFLYLVTIPQLNLSNCYNCGSMCSSLNNLENCGGFLNLGNRYVQKTENYSNYILGLQASYKLSVESAINVLNSLYDLNLSYKVATGGTLYRQKVQFHATVLANLQATSEGQQAIADAVAKGWNIA